jgi:hypothetical protein
MQVNTRNLVWVLGFYIEKNIKIIGSFKPTLQKKKFSFVKQHSHALNKYLPTILTFEDSAVKHD